MTRKTLIPSDTTRPTLFLAGPGDETDKEGGGREPWEDGDWCPGCPGAPKD